MSATSSHPRPENPLSDCDLKDDLDDPRFRLLPLPECQKAGLTSAFHACDQSALSNRNWHRWMARTAIVSGSVAAILTTAELAAKFLPAIASIEESLFRLEEVLVAILVVVVLWGALFGYKEKWLADRHRASLCAQLKFEFLMQPNLWHTPAGGESYLRQQWHKRRSPSDHKLVETAVFGPLPHAGMPVDEHFTLPQETLRQLIEYYLERRLTPQLDYLKSGSRKHEAWDEFLRRAIFSLFLLTVAAVALHAAVHTFWPVAEWIVALVPLAVALPLLAMMLRAFQSAFEYSRNRRRFGAAYAALEEKERILRHDMLPQYLPGGREKVLATAVLRELWWCEHVLAGEHLEWLGLMHETEWFV
jgi:hypothetical protein